MAHENYILITQFCEYSRIEYSFVENLYEYGLIRLETKESAEFIDEEDIPEIERLYRLHQDLGINYEGLDAIKHMLNRIDALEKQLKLLKKRIDLYE